MSDRQTREQVLNEIAIMIESLIGDRLEQMIQLALPGVGGYVAQSLDDAAPDWREGTRRMQWLVAELVARAEQEGRIYELLEAVRAAFPDAEWLCEEMSERYWQTVELHAGPLESMVDLPELLPETSVPELPPSTPEPQAPEPPPLHPPTTPPTNTGDRSTEDAPRIESLRLDTAVPEQVVVGQAFTLAVGIKQIASPKLNRPDLTVVESGDIEVLWLPGQAFIRLRIQISAPDCIVSGNDSDSFRLVAGRDSPVFLYHLTPKRHGPISIFVTVYQEDDRLGTAGINTTARDESAGTVAGEMTLTVQSQPLGKLFPAAEAIQPLYGLALELVAEDTLTPLLIAEQAGLVRAQIDQVPKPADQWWIVLIAAHEGNCLAAIAKAIADRYPNRSGDIKNALDFYEREVALVP